jgi:hypothetical protein
MRKKMGNLSLSRRRLIGGLGGAAVIAGLPACGGGNSGTNQPPYQAAASISDGYTDKQSYRPSDSVTLFINAPTAQRTMLNLYNFANVVVHTVPADLYPQTPVGSTPWETGFGYQESVTFTLPSLPSGVYTVEGIIPLIVRTAAYPPTPSQQPEVLILYPTNTIAAYNTSGGRSMYSVPVPAPIVSFDRPMGDGSNFAFFDAFLEWLADTPLPYSTGYIADIDLEDYGTLDGVKVLVVIGHSEYWTRQARENFDRFVLSGGNVLLLTGNTMWWQIRYSDDLSQMICYKEVPDPIANPLLKTINWTKNSLEYPTVLSVGADFPRGGFGLGYPNSGGFRVLSPNSPVFRGIFIRSGDVITIPTVEYDGAPLLNDPITEGGEPQLDLAALGAYRAEIIGYEYCSGNDSETGPGKVADNVATWIVYQRTATSGVIMNGASTNWCSRTGAFGTDGFRVRQIILNMLDSLANNQSLFVG